MLHKHFCTFCGARYSDEDPSGEYKYCNTCNTPQKRASITRVSNAIQKTETQVMEENNFETVVRLY
jgi:hypothetical protein